MSFIPIPDRGGMVPLARERGVTPSVSWLQGALLIITTGLYAECGADPALITGVSASDVGTGNGPQYPVAGRKEFPPNFVQAFWAGHEAGFTALYVGTLPALSGAAYGVVKDTDNFWKVDFTDTVATRLTLTSVKWAAAPLSQNRVRVKFLAASVGVM